MAATREASRPAFASGTPEALFSKLSPGPGKPASEVAAHQCARLHSAMIELVAEHGYASVTVRKLTEFAGVSTRSFYQHFDGKEDCFLRTHELIVRRTVKRIAASQAGEQDWQKRLRLAFASFVRELEREPRSARLALVEAYAAGPRALEQIRRIECTFEAMISESFARASDQLAMPPLILEGMVAGVARVARAQLAAEDEGGNLWLGDALLDWTLCFRGPAVAELAELDRCPVAAHLGKPVLPAWPNEENGQTKVDERTLILSAVAKLTTTEGYGALTVAKIRAAAGTSRKGFEAHFSSVEDCFLATLELRASLALAQAARARPGGRSWEGAVYLMIGDLCMQVATDPVLARLCFVDVFAPGAGGMRCRERLVANILDVVRGTVPSSELPDELAIEASVGAIWGIIHHHVVSGRAQQLPRITATLSFLALAPLVGAPAATEAIRRERTNLIEAAR